jgi:amidase/aspartyl-tRNA(Asn)/glutamyl-tRNA(Gln) amidotransferase subunit A
MSVTELTNMSLQQLVAGFRSQALSPVEIMDATLRHAESVNVLINALFSIRAEAALADARVSEARWARGEPLGPLDGVPVTVKDSVAVAGWPYYHGTRPNRDLPPSGFDAPPAARLKEGGAIIFAKTVMPDCGLMASGVSSMHGVVRNPWSLRFNPGGSSAGAGASLAAGVGFLSVGSDIAGSVRLPASHCGLAALKPTQGRIPHLAPDMMRSAGPMGRRVADIALVLTTLSRPDVRDCWSLPPDGLRYEGRLDRSLRGLRIGLLTDLGFDPRPEPAVLRAVEDAASSLERLGAGIEPLQPLFDHDAYDPIDRVLQVRGFAEIDSFPEDRRREVTDAVYEWARPAAAYSARDFAGFVAAIAADRTHILQALHAYDYVLAPVLPVVNFPAEWPGLAPDKPLRHANFTAPFNQTAQPAASVHQAFDERGLPIGVQVIGRRFDDLGVLQMAHAIEISRSPIRNWPVEPSS